MKKQSIMYPWRKWADTAAVQFKAASKGRCASHKTKQAKQAEQPKRPLVFREPTGLCRLRHHDPCTLNSVSPLTAELRQHTVDLEFAIDRQHADLRNVHVYHLDDVIKELWLLRGRMAGHAARNGSPVRPEDSCMFSSVRAVLDNAIRVRKEHTSE